MGEGHGARLDFGPCEGRERTRGYRLVYNPRSKPAFALLRVGAGRSSVIEVYAQSVNLEDGRPHSLEWRRGTDGEMVVLLDDKEIIRTSFHEKLPSHKYRTSSDISLVLKQLETLGSVCRMD